MYQCHFYANKTMLILCIIFYFFLLNSNFNLKTRKKKYIPQKNPFCLRVYSHPPHTHAHIHLYSCWHSGKRCMSSEMAPHSEATKNIFMINIVFCIIFFPGDRLVMEKYVLFFPVAQAERMTLNPFAFCYSLPTSQSQKGLQIQSVYVAF